MTPEEIAAQEAEKAAQAAAEAEAIKNANPEDLLKQIAILNSENASRRIKEKELADQLDKINAAKKSAEEKEALERGEHLTLLESTKGELETATGRLTAMEEALNKIYEVEEANVPEAMRALIPTGDIPTKLAWIATAKEAKLFEPKSGPGMRSAGEHSTTSLEEQHAAAMKEGNLTLALQIKSKIREKLKNKE